MKNPARIRLKPARPGKVRLTFKTSQNTNPPRSGSKLATMLVLLERQDGASIGELVQVTDWREHSVRAALTGIAKRWPDRRLTSVRSHQGLRRYHVTDASNAGTQPAGSAR